MRRIKRFQDNAPMYQRLEGFFEWLAMGHCKIKDRMGRLIPLDPNPMQQRLFEVMLKQAYANKPVRVIILKGRKGGASTFIQALYYYLAKSAPHISSRVIAHTDDSTRDIYEISHRIMLNDDSQPKPKGPANPMEWEHDSSLTTRTAGGQYVSSGSNIQNLHLSELPKWPGTKQSIKDQLSSVLQSVPEVPNSIVIIESTANMADATGEYRERWDNAVAGLSPYVSFFSPWYEEPSYRIEQPELPESLGEYLAWLREEFDLDDGQLAWYHNKLHGDFNGDHLRMKQEYPTTPEEAFQSPEGRIFPIADEKRHKRVIEITAEHEVFRALDWGGVDPFVCLWVAHTPGPPGFTVDIAACPNTWREIQAYHWGDNAKPVDKDNHTCDALRYAVMHFALTGHVHVFREIYEPHSASRGLTILDLAERIKLESREPIVGTVADRSQPGNITLMNNRGVYADPYAHPGKPSVNGMIIDGIDRINGLMNAIVPLEPDKPKVDWQAEMIRNHGGEIPAGVNVETAVALSAYMEERGAVDPMMGACG